MSQALDLNTSELPPLCPARSRVLRSQLQAERAAVQSLPHLTQLLDAYPGLVVVLNGSRQIVAANQAFAGALGSPHERLFGLRVGEAFDCVHSAEDPEGCGTTEFCRHCGAAQAMAEFERTGASTVAECHIARDAPAGPDALDLRVWARPLAVGDETYMLFCVQDIAAEKRRDVLERLFFHDVLNTAGAIRGFLDLLPPADSSAAEFRSIALKLSDFLIDEIQAQRELLAAERGELEPRPETIEVNAHLLAIQSLLSSHPAAEGKSIAVSCPPGAKVRVDPLLLRRVLVNLTKNALEASGAGQSVSIAFDAHPHPTFSVRNRSVMAPGVKAQIFQRSFSTKGGHGRGVGTHSVRLLTERYLQGRVWFTSEAAQGTTFFVQLPEAPTG